MWVGQIYGYNGRLQVSLPVVYNPCAIVLDGIDSNTSFGSQGFSGTISNSTDPITILPELYNGNTLIIVTVVVATQNAQITISGGEGTGSANHTGSNIISGTVPTSDWKVIFSRKTGNNFSTITFGYWRANAVTAETANPISLLIRNGSGNAISNLQLQIAHTAFIRLPL